MGMEPKPISDAFLGCFDKEHQQQQPILSSRPYKKRLSEDQVKFLEMSFSFEKKLEPQRKVQLAYDLGLHPRQVAIWYQNKRARWKTQRLELDYNALKTQMESIVTEKRKLEKEVSRLTVELDHAKEIIRKSCGMEIMGSSAAESGEELMVIRDQEVEEEEEEEEEEEVEDVGGCDGVGVVCHHGSTGGVKVEGGGGGAGGGSGGNIMEDLYACLVGFDAGHAHGKLHCFDLF